MPGHRRQLHPRRDRLVLRRVASKEGGFGKFEHHRELAPIDNQTVIRHEPRHALFGGGVRSRCRAGDDHAARCGQALHVAADRSTRTTTRRRSIYGAGQAYAYAEEGRHALRASAGVRTLVDPNDPKDVEQVHALQDAIKVEQPGGPGKFEVPNWDPASQKKVRDALLVLGATTLTDTKPRVRHARTRSIPSGT